MADENKKSSVQEPSSPAAETDTKATEAGEAEETKPKFPDNEVTVEDAGTLKKKIAVQVNHQKIDAKFDEMFGELGRTAQIPGFRIGRAPRRLIEKRFGKEVADDIRNALVGEAVGEALKQADFKSLGEPQIDLDEIKLPEEGPLTFSFEVEVAPEFDLPEYKGIEITRPATDITDEHLEEALAAHLRGYGKLKPVNSPIKADDLIVADVQISGQEIDHKRPNVELRVAPGQVEGIPLEDLPKILTGKKSGQCPRFKTTVPAGYPNEDWREKEVTLTFDIKEVKRLELPALDKDFAKQAGFASVDELRETVRRNLKERASFHQRRMMRDQVCKYLLTNTSFDLPEGIAQRHASRLLARRYVDMMMRGVPREQIEQDLQVLESAASEQAADELKLAFILAKVAEAESVEVDDDQINARIAQMARRDNRRPERLRQEMADEGTLDQLTVAIQEEMAIEKLLESASITDAAPDSNQRSAVSHQQSEKRNADC